MRRTGDLKLIQELNQFIVLDTIRQEGPISRSDIAKKHDLSLTTVTSAVNKLMDQGLVIEGGIGESRGGRRPILVQFSPNGRYLIGVSLRNSRLTMAEMNLNAEIRRKTVLPFELEEKQNVIDFIIDSIQTFIKGCDQRRACIGISLITQGIVHSKDGVIQFNPKLKMRDVPLKKLLEERFALEVWVDNDVNAFILAEKHFCLKEKLENLIYITIGDGLGAGIVVNGSIYRGRQGGSGEFGHTTIDQGGIPCDCGNTGCLENYVSWPAIYSRILSSVKKGNNTKMMKLIEGDITKLTPDIFVKAITIGDQLALDLLDQIATYLSVGMVNLIHLFNPEMIILGGDIVTGNPIFLSKVKANVKRFGFSMLVENLEIRETTLGHDIEMVGAASVLLQDIFRFSLNEMTSFYAK